MLELRERFLFYFFFERAGFVGGFVGGGEREEGFEGVGVALEGGDAGGGGGGGGGVPGEEPLVDVGPVFGELRLLPRDGGGEDFGWGPDVPVVGHF